MSLYLRYTLRAGASSVSSRLRPQAFLAYNSAQGMSALPISFQWDPSRLHFEFPLPHRETRFKELFLYISLACLEDKTFSSIKLNKIFFYSDFDAYGRYGKPITGVAYRKLANGPAPRPLVPLREELIRDGALGFAKRPVHDLYRERAFALREPNYDLFSAREISIVEDYIRFFWNWTSKEISEYSHGMAWKIAVEGELIPYEAVFISDDPVTEEDVTRARELAAQHGWKV